METTKDLYDALVALSTREEAHGFLKDLCTPQEINALQERWRVCQLLADGQHSYREIHDVTGASLTTISRVARFLKDEPYQGYQNMLKKLNCGEK
ncbi:MAG: YerC/YecD family TrpR-related protein [Pseudomonadota bacterium]